MSPESRERVKATFAGQPEWGTHGSAREHIRYAQQIPPASRRRCPCCRTRSTHVGMANGLAMMSGCEMRVRRWVKEGR